MKKCKFVKDVKVVGVRVKIAFYCRTGIYFKKNSFTQVLHKLSSSRKLPDLTLYYVDVGKHCKQNATGKNGK